MNMVRIAFFEKQEPVVIGDKQVCQCGLSKGFPFCDSSHNKTKDEKADKLYQYVDGKAVVIGQFKKSACGGDCHCHDNEEEKEHHCGCD